MKATFRGNLVRECIREECRHSKLVLIINRRGVEYAASNDSQLLLYDIII